MISVGACRALDACGFHSESSPTTSSNWTSLSSSAVDIILTFTVLGRVKHPSSIGPKIEAYSSLTIGIRTRCIHFFRLCSVLPHTDQTLACIDRFVAYTSYICSNACASSAAAWVWARDKGLIVQSDLFATLQGFAPRCLWHNCDKLCLIATSLMSKTFFQSSKGKMFVKVDWRRLWILGLS